METCLYLGFEPLSFWFGSELIGCCGVIEDQGYTNFNLAIVKGSQLTICLKNVSSQA